MNSYLKTLGLHVYLATIKKSYIGNDKHIEANAQTLIALRQSLSKKHLSLIYHCDSAFAVWTTLTSLKEQMINNLEKESRGNKSDEACYMV